MQAQAHEERVGGSGGRSSVPGKETAARVAGLDLSAAAQRARHPPPPPRGLGSASLMSQSLIGRTWFPPSSSKFQGNAETSRVSADETARGTGSRLLSAGLRSGGGRSEGFAYTVPSAWKAPPHPRLILQAVASAASATPAGLFPDRPPADLPAGSGPPVTPSPGCP